MLFHFFFFFNFVQMSIGLSNLAALVILVQEVQHFGNRFLMCRSRPLHFAVRFVKVEA